MITDKLSWPPTTGSGDLKRLRAINVLCVGAPQLIRFLFKPDRPEMCAEPEEMIRRAGVLSGGEQVLVRVALDIWFYENEGFGHFMDVIRRLDNKNFEAVINAMLIARSI